MIGARNAAPRPRDVERTGDDTPVSSLPFFIWRMSGWHQALGIVVALAVTVLGLVPVELQRRLFDDALAENDRDLLIVLGLIYVGVILGHKLLKFCLGLIQGWISESTALYMRGHLWGLNEKSSTDEDNERKLIAILTKEVEKLAGFVGGGPSELTANGSMLLGTLAYMLYVEPFVALLGIACLVPQIIFAPLLQRKLNRLVRIQVVLMRRYSGAIGNDGSQQSLGQAAKRLYRNRMTFLFWKFLLKSVLNLLNDVTPVVVIVMGGLMVLDGGTTIGVIVAFVSAFGRLGGPIRALIGFYREAAQAEVHHVMISDWMMARIKR